MVTKRTPIRRAGRRQITKRAVELFTEMAAIPCSCKPRNWDGEYWRHEECAGCERWWTLHSELHDELRARPWEWPCVEDAAAENPYPSGSFAAQRWDRERSGKPEKIAAIALWRELEAAAAAKPKKRRQ
jgi:hypothetical protein